MDEKVSYSGDELSDEVYDLYSNESQSENDQDESDTSSQNTDQTPGPSNAKRPRKHSSKDLEDTSLFSELEKICLLNALKDYGTGNFEALYPRIPTKTPNEIKEYLIRQRKKTTARLKEGVRPDEQAPIDKWIQNLIKRCPNDDYKKQYIARALKYIALFEEREVENEQDVSLSDCYLTLSALMSGEGPKLTDNVTAYFMHTVIQDFIRELKGSNNTEDLKHLKKSSKPAVKCYGKKKKTPPSEDQCSNSLGIPEEILKFKTVLRNQQLQ